MKIDCDADPDDDGGHVICADAVQPGNDVGNNDSVSNEKIRTKRGCMPPKDSVLWNYLNSVKQKVLDGEKSGALNSTRFKSEQGQKWIMPDFDPSSVPTRGKPTKCYQHEAWVCFFDPFYQFENRVKMSECKCIHCGEPRLQSKDCHCRPMFHHEQIVWLLHRRLWCQHCCRTCTTIDPHFLANLPTTV